VQQAWPSLARIALAHGLNADLAHRCAEGQQSALDQTLVNERELGLDY